MFKKHVRIEFWGYSPERFINLCKQKEIVIWGLESELQRYRCFLYAKDFKGIKTLARKTSVHIRIIEKHGIGFTLFYYRKRKIFLIGIALAVFLIFYLSRFIWNIEIIGNNRITDDVLYDYLEVQNIYHGMRRKDVDCDWLCKQIRLDFYDITWVSAALDGTNLCIEIREGKEISELTKNDETYADLLSDMDGVVVNIITRKGVPKVKEGDQVKAGDILVSGIVEIKNDAGEVIREEKINADADIWILRKVEYEEYCENIYYEKKYLQAKKYRILGRWNEYQFALGFRKVTGEQERVCVYYPLRFGENYVLPLEIGMEISREYTLEKREYEINEQKMILEDRYRSFYERLLEQGLEIVSENLYFQEEEGRMGYLGELEVIQQVVDLY